MLGFKYDFRYRSSQLVPAIFSIQIKENLHPVPRELLLWPYCCPPSFGGPAVFFASRRLYVIISFTRGPFIKLFFVELPIIKPQPFIRPHLLISASASSRVEYVLIGGNSLWEDVEVEWGCAGFVVVALVDRSVNRSLESRGVTWRELCMLEGGVLLDGIDCFWSAWIRFCSIRFYISPTYYWRSSCSTWALRIAFWLRNVVRLALGASALFWKESSICD